MESKQITINGVTITAHSDGSITRPFHGRPKSTFGSKTRAGYMKVTINYRTFEVHRIIGQAFLPEFPDFPQVDHVDGDKANNNIENLRMSTSLGNMQAHLAKASGCSSEYRGVAWHKQQRKWRATCRINHKWKHIGYFDDERDAAIARDAFVFSRGFSLEGLNFPENHKTP